MKTNYSRIWRTFALLTVISLASATLFAGEVPLTLEFDVPGVTYDGSVSTPEEVLGHQIGNRHTRPSQVVTFFKTLAGQSDRVIFGTHGTTYEGRPLVHAFVSSPSNLEKLDELKMRNRAISEQPDDFSNRNLAQMPVFVYMGYSIHGNEASGSEAALLLLYHLAAGRGDPVSSVLENAVLIIDPMFNPDGRSRFVNWVNANRGRVATSDPSDREHREPWPGGRTNHYWFDLNRDWLPAQLKESQGRLELYHDCRPQLVTDFHEMGSNSTFFFQPGVPTRNNPNTPERTIELTGEIARFHARALDRIGSLYFSGESYDDFYFGKGSTYPDINGAIGILFEQASSRSLVRETDSGILEYGFTIRNQLAASLSTLEAAVSLRLELLKNHRDFFLENRRQASSNPVKAYLIKSSPARRHLPMIEILLRHGIRVFRLEKKVNADGLDFQAQSDWIVPTDQRQGRLLKTLMEEVTSFSDTVFYDVSTWALPPAFAVHTAELTQPIDQLVGEELESAPVNESLIEDPASYAYLMQWDHVSAPRALYRLQEAGLRVRVLKKGVEINASGQSLSFEPSTIIIPVRQPSVSPERLHALIREVAQKENVKFRSVSTGATSKGPDLGGPSTHFLERPKILLLAGEGTRSNMVGSTWFILNERFGIPVSLVNSSVFGDVDLSKYNTVIFAGRVPASINDEEINRLKSWIHKGGLFLATRSASQWAIQHGVVQGELRDLPQDELDLPYDEVAASRRSQSIPGTIFRITLDTSHPVSYGFSQEAYVFRDHETAIEPSKLPGSNVGIYSDSEPVSGYAPQNRAAVLSGSAAVIALQVNSGTAVLFVDDPNFRAFWYGTTGLFLNALFFGKAF